MSIVWGKPQERSGGWRALGRTLLSAAALWALLAWAAYILRKYGPRVIAVTGSSGKTTTTTLVGEMLAAAGLRVLWRLHASA